MRIEGVAISCYKFDVQLTRLCVASIRFWYPHIPIWLLKDRHYGDFNTHEIEGYWNVRVYPVWQRKLGWGCGKLEVLTELRARRILLLDSDIVFIGRVIDRLENFDEDLIVSKEDYDNTTVELHFFPLDKLRQLDPKFEFPGYGFNGGQIVATTGHITKRDFDGLLDWETRTVMHPEVFKMGDQGLVNYVVLRNVQQGKLTIRREPFMVWPGEAERTGHIRVEDFTPEGGHPQLIHWAGLGWGKMLEEMPRSDILSYFEKIYYRRVPLGAWLRLWRRTRFRAQRTLITPIRILAKRLLSKLL